MDDMIASIGESLARQAQSGRVVVALAGPPGAGKSTFAAALTRHLTEMGVRARLVPMDGFHLDDAVLEASGWRARKGAPHTYDVGGLKTLLEKIRDGREPVYYPVFDRTLELSRAAGDVVVPEDQVVIVEGNYLLLDEPGWADMAGLFDETIMLTVPETELENRLQQRWAHLGLGESEARAKIEGNDLVNARLVLARSRAADITIANSARSPGS